MRDRVQGRGLTDRRTPQLYRLTDANPSLEDPKASSTVMGGRGGPWPGSACADSSPAEGRKEEREREKRERGREGERGDSRGGEGEGGGGGGGVKPKSYTLLGGMLDNYSNGMAVYSSNSSMHIFCCLYVSVKWFKIYSSLYVVIKVGCCPRKGKLLGRIFGGKGEERGEEEAKREGREKRGQRVKRGEGRGKKRRELRNLYHPQSGL